MLASINPLGERARGTKFGRTFAWYAAGSVAGGAAIGALMGGIGEGLRATVDLSHSAVAIVIAVACAIGIALDTHVAGLRLLSPRRQVNEDWLSTYRGWLYGVGFGFELGLGVVTVVPTSAVYVMLLLEVLSGSMVHAVLIGVAFGAARALPLLVTRPVRDPDQLRTTLGHVHRYAIPVDLLTRAAVTTLGAVGIVAAVVA